MYNLEGTPGHEKVLPISGTLEVYLLRQAVEKLDAHPRPPISPSAAVSKN